MDWSLKEKFDVGFVIRNEHGNMIGAGAFNLDGATINEVEAKALKEGLKYAKRKGFKKSWWKAAQALCEIPLNLISIVEDRVNCQNSS
ncbi:hypothetical protein DVH24_024862 [Malus domestica]|uniref:RNase H type-1 domain-containing protein n=1 Tax=Malus domestica TaxID=3750 RepID=A0A498JHK3_MALDO|nr:hypothetical protein DVH24_024862 [Malus domestica]